MKPIDEKASSDGARLVVLPDDIRQMSDSDLLDMDYFLSDEDQFDDFGEEGFYIF